METVLMSILIWGFFLGQGSSEQQPGIGFELNGVLRPFQQYFSGNSSHYSYRNWVSQVLGWGSEVSCPLGHSHKKPRGSSATRTQDPWITSQNTLPLSHTGPSTGFKTLYHIKIC